MVCRIAPLNISITMKSLKFPPFLVQFHCTQVHSVLPKFRFDTPTKSSRSWRARPPMSPESSSDEHHTINGRDELLVKPLIMWML
uniref:Putative ovule protein n=1 Tax=Solanum chacoense TaxID=4108 RepID=A0A0V0GL99_SOLCH